MNRKEFLDILIDYLKKDFSEDEISDIIRDYEEYFVNSEIEGKSDLDTITALGSPKSIARDLINQIKDEQSKNNKENKIKDIFTDLKMKIKKYCSKCKNSIEEKLTPSISNSNFMPNKGIKILIFLLSLVLIIPTFIVICFMVSMAGILALSLIFFLLTIPLIVSFSWSSSQIAIFFIFLSIAFIGFQILAWQVFVLIVKYMKKIYKKYINWIKTRKMYINASETKKIMDIQQSKGGKDNE